MTFEYLTDPERGPQGQGLLPGAPEAFAPDAVLPGLRVA